MKRLIIISCLFLAIAGQAQNNIDEILQSIEASNRELQAQRELMQTQKLEAKTGNYLADPSVEYEHIWGNKTRPEKTGELTVSQSFDFPTVYSNRSKIARLKSSLYDHNGAEFRQTLLLQAKEACLELIYLRKQKALLDERLANAQKLSNIYTQKLSTGDANILEINKIELELINTRTEANLNEIAITTKLQELANLNGGKPIDFNLQNYPVVQNPENLDNVMALYVESNPGLKGYKSELEVANKEISLSKAKVLPKFELGYKGDFEMKTLNSGILVGMSIPMFENKNTIKKAKAQAKFAETQVESATLNLQTEIQQLYNQSQTLNSSLQSLSEIMQRFGNLDLLNKALESGQISLTDYFVELTPRYQSKQTQLQVERDYYITLARLYKFEL
ncbi:MAG: TolC family protein [Bacteroidales bacterium]|nr:TolC family protein [Bacteroidales bacterium]